MKILLEFQALRSIWNLKSFYRLFHQDHKVFASLNLSNYEAINRCEQEVPEYFNFASDVLDQWSQVEKVDFLFPYKLNIWGWDLGPQWNQG